MARAAVREFLRTSRPWRSGQGHAGCPATVSGLVRGAFDLVSPTGFEPVLPP